MTAEEIGKKLSAQLDSAVLELKSTPTFSYAKVDAQKIVEAATFMRDDPSLRFDFLRSLAGVDYKGELEVVYMLFSYPHRHEFALKVRVPTEHPNVPSVESVWPAANWHEREAFDLLGIQFDGNSDLRRIFMPEDWIGHPLRKDYKEQDQYHGIATTREYQTGMTPLPTAPPIVSGK